jgi:hypothetical protein
MQRFLSSVFALAFAASLGTSAFAQGAMATTAPAMTKTTSSTSCPKGETYVKGYTKSDGTKVAGYCRAASSSSMASSKSCPKGETWVAPYTKSDGTKVAGYCRAASKSSSSMKSSSMKSAASPSAMKSMASPAPAATK